MRLFWTNHAVLRIKQRMRRHLDRKIPEARILSAGVGMEIGRRYELDFDGVHYVCERCPAGVVVITIMRTKIVSRKIPKDNHYRRVKKWSVDED